MSFSEVVVLIPSHSLEDFPSELPEQQAAGLLNAFAVAWHPALLAQTRQLPQWARADEPSADFGGKLFLSSEAVRDWLPHDWHEQVQQGGGQIIEADADRPALLQTLAEVCELPADADGELVADFLALGTGYLQVELLTRHMHYFSNIDESHIQRQALAGAEAVISGDRTAAETHLRACAEALLDARERFYPVDSYLLDLCLLVPSVADEHLQRLLASGHSANFLISAADLDEIGAADPELLQQMATAWSQGDISVIGGEREEFPVPLVPLETFLFDFRVGHETFRRRLQKTPQTWARRRFGFSTLLPQVLKRHDYHSALHVALDDGIYPDQEQSKIQWEGCDGTVIDAISRIPLAGDSATSMLRLPLRMAETMEQDHVAALVFARWPELRTPWLDDLQRLQRYAPVLGRMVTFDDFFDQTDSPGRLSQFDEREYLSPFLVQFVASELPDGISRFRRAFANHVRWQTAEWLTQLQRLLTGQKPQDLSELQAELENCGPDSEPGADADCLQRIDRLQDEAVESLRDVFLQQSGDDQSEAGLLVFNSRSFPRIVDVTIPRSAGRPVADETLIAEQQDEQSTHALVKLPESGFTWLRLQPDAEAGPPPTDFAPLAMENMIRNELFEVHVNRRTGGIEQVKEYGRRPNRLSQQLAFRFRTEQSVRDTEDPQHLTKTWYSRMHCTDFAITSVGPAYGEITTRGQLIDDSTEVALADYEQIVRIGRGRPTFDLSIRLTPHQSPNGSPWATYFASRFAWNDSTASLTRSVLEMAHGASGDRFESPHFLEIASDSERTTVLTEGLCFHRKTGPRMVDTLLICEGERQTEFHFRIAVDQAYPMQAAWDAMTPVPTILTQGYRPRGPSSGWLFRTRQRNVQLTRILPEPVPLHPAEDSETPASTTAFIVRLVETEGTHQRVQVETFRTPTRAVRMNFHGQEIGECTIDSHGVIDLELTGYEICDLRLQFD